VADDLKVLFPGQDITVGGETLTVKPFAFGLLPRVVQLLRKITDALKAPSVDVLQVMEAGGSDLMDLLALTTGKPRAWIDALPLDEGVLLTGTVLEVNRDVFTKAVVPRLSGLFSALGLEPSTGATSSESSSQPATDGPTSSPTP
jgi:hypothetical protein